MIDFITDDPKFAISLAAGVLGIVLAAFFYFRSKSVKEPCYSRKSTVLIDPEIVENNPIKVSFQDRPVERLTLSYVALWNNGRATISGDDISEIDPLRIVALNGCSILAADLVQENKHANDFRIDLIRQDDTVIVSFNFVDYKNGAIIRVYHSGDTSRDIDVVGTIKGVDSLIDVDKTGHNFIGLLEHITDFTMGRLFRLPILKPLLDLTEEAERRQSFFLSALTSFLFVFIGFPFYSIYYLIMIPVIFIGAPYFMFIESSHTVPKELYSIMRTE